VTAKNEEGQPNQIDFGHVDPHKTDSGTGANTLLAYFHYCNKGIYPFSGECKDQDLQSLAELDDETMAFVRYTRRFASDYSELPQPTTIVVQTALGSANPHSLLCRSAMGTSLA
jgi:hypothetical protein